jgi:hypothetical protein
VSQLVLGFGTQVLEPLEEQLTDLVFVHVHPVRSFVPVVGRSVRPQTTGMPEHETSVTEASGAGPDDSLGVARDRQLGQILVTKVQQVMDSVRRGGTCGRWLRCSGRRWLQCGHWCGRVG